VQPKYVLSYKAYSTELFYCVGKFNFTANLPSAAKLNIFEAKTIMHNNPDRDYKLIELKE